VRLLVVFSLVLAVATVAAAQPTQPTQPTPAAGEALFVVSGRGWGHGVGMSQYGAYGMAKAGHTHDEILAHYYSGTELGRAGTKQVRVLLAEGRRALTLSSAAPFSARDARGEIYRLPKGPLTLQPTLKLPTEKRPARAVSPLLVRPAKAAPLSLDGSLYRGQLEIVSQGGFLRVVNVLPLESYLEGVVAGEVPHTWPTEALEAQAVAARSYALASRVEGKPFDLYSDVRSQVYLGVAGEKPRTTAAVRATAGQVVRYGGQIATTYYFSTSGGKTASAADVFGFAVPYLVSRPDPWDNASPYHRWGPVLLGARTVQARLDIDARVLDATGVVTPSGRLRSLTVQTAQGSTTVPGVLLRTGLGLRSTWVTVGVLRLDLPRGPVVFGSSVRLTGIARGLPGPVVASSPDGGSSWSKVGAPERGATGLVSLAVAPTRTTRYRIEVDGAASPALLVQVAPRVQLQSPSEPRSLSGIVRPRLTGADVTVERRQGSAWTPVSKARVDATGAFRTQLSLVPGSYRARVAATGSWAEGVAPALVITG
jgi:stage II sporulation protein D